VSIWRPTAAARPFWTEHAAGFFGRLFRGVSFSPAFIGLLYYTLAVVTFRAPGARWAMLAAVLTLPLQTAPLRWHAVLSWLSAFAVWSWVSALSVGGFPVAVTGAEDISKLAVIAIVIFNAVRTTPQVRFYLSFLLGCFLLFPVRGALVNYLFGYSTFGRALWNYAYANPNDLAGFGLVFLSIALGYIFTTTHKLWRLGAIGASAVITIMIGLTQSRGAFLALIATTVLVFMTMRQRGRMLGIAACIGVMSLPFIPSSAYKRFGGLLNASTQSGMRGVDKEGSAEQRYQVLQLSAIMATENLTVGVGPMMYRGVSVAYGSRFAGRFPLARSVADPHNTLLRVACEMGLVGVVIFVGMVGTIMLRAWRTSGEMLARGEAGGTLQRMLMFGLVAYMLAGLFSSIPYINVLYFLLAILASVDVASREWLTARTAPLVPVPSTESMSTRFARRAIGVRGGLANAG
jgi:O-antigen ligase